MAFFYLRSGHGTRTSGGGITKQTGAFTSIAAGSVYGSISDIMSEASPPAAGDFVVVSDSHSESYGGVVTLASAVSAPVTWISAADANCDQYSRATATQITASSNADLLLGGTEDGLIACYGLWFEGGDDIRTGGENSSVYTFECTFEANSTGDICWYTNTYSRVLHDNATFRANNSSANIFGVLRGRTVVKGGTIAGTAVNDMIYAGQTGSGVIIVDGLDMSGLATSADIVENIAGASTDAHYFEFRNCKLPASWSGSWFNADPERSKIIRAARCASTSAAAEYQFYLQSGACVAEDNSAIYRNGSSVWDMSGTAKTSIQIDTDDTATPGQPFIVPLTMRYADLTNAASDTLTIELASADTLDDAEVYAIARYTDDTNNHEQNSTKVAAAQAAFGVGSTLSSSAEGWTGAPANKYKIDIATSNGEKGPVAVDLYVCYDNSSGTGTGNPLYVCTSIDVG